MEYMERITFPGRDSRKLSGILNHPPGIEDAPVAVLVHGLGSTKDSTTNQMLETVLLERAVPIPSLSPRPMD